MELGLKDKRVLVTGSSKGIGFAIAKAFLNEGSKTMISARDQKHLAHAEEELKTSYEETLVQSKTCDFTNAQSLESLLDHVKKTWDGLDIVIANVGSGTSVPDALPNDKDWKNVWTTNFETALETSRTFLPMLKNSKGSLLFIASIAGIEAIDAPIGYSTAKSAILALSKNLSRKLGNQVRVNVVAPGNILFEGGSWDYKIKKDPASVKEIIKMNVPMNRFGIPEEVADAVIFLSSDRAAFITGSVLVVDGGQTLGGY